MNDDRHLTAKELIGLPLDGGRWPSSEFGVKKKAEALGLPKRKRAGTKAWEYPVTSLPEPTQAALILQSAPVAPRAPRVAADLPPSADLWSWYEQRPSATRDEAQRKVKAVQQVVALITVGQAVNDACAAVGREIDASLQTVRRWYYSVREAPASDWPPLLADRYGGGGRVVAECTPEAWEFFKALYLRLERPNAATCYDDLQTAAQHNGWTIPSLKTLMRRIEALPLATRVVLREGEEALRRLYPALERDVSMLGALQWVNGDGYSHNVFVKWLDGSIERPKTWVWQDVYSRMIVGWITDKSENADALRLSLGDVVERYGIMDDIVIDNTRAAANKWMTGGVRNRYRFKVKEDEPFGIFPSLGVQVHWTSVFAGGGWGQAKPVERQFSHQGGWGEYIDKAPEFAGAWTGPDTTEKPANYASKAVALEKFLQVLAERIERWNTRTGRRTEMGAGEKSFRQVFDESYSSRPIRRATAEQRRLWLLSAEHIRVQADGSFTLSVGAILGRERNRYHADALIDHAGQYVTARFDPGHLHGEVYVYDTAGRYLTAAVCLDPAAFGDSETGRAHARARNAWVRASKEAAKEEARMDAIEAARLLPAVTAELPPEARIVRPARASVPIEPPRPAVDPVAAEQAQAGLARLRERPVATLETPRQRYDRWLSCAATVAAAGGDVDVLGAQAHWFGTYPTTAEYRTQQRLRRTQAGGDTGQTSA